MSWSYSLKASNFLKKI